MRALLTAVIALALVGGPTVVTYAADETIGQKIDDTAITTKVKTKLTTERAKNLVKVHVETKDGVVHLQGTVPSETDKAEAERLARSTSGVREVMNELQVEGATGSTPSASPGTK
jgi:hyperosmotically inducible periplasmic protein